MYSCDQGLVTVEFLWEKLSEPQIYKDLKDLTRKTPFLRVGLGSLKLTLGIAGNFTPVWKKDSNKKWESVWGIISTFVEDTGKKLKTGREKMGVGVGGGGAFCPFLQLSSWAGSKLKQSSNLTLLFMILLFVRFNFLCLSLFSFK